VAKTLSVTIPHNLTQDEARRRIQLRISQLRSEFGHKVGGVQEQWTDNHLIFDVQALGQHVHGRMEVDPSTIHLEVDLPWMLALLGGRLQKEVQEEGRKLLT
jgi:hypothetical protein